MKKMILTSAICLFSLLAVAQQCYIPGYGAAQLRHSNVNGSGNVLIGGYGGWLLSERLMIGAGGFGTLQKIDVTSENGSTEYGMGYNGLVTEYNLPLSQHWQLVGGTLVGGGRFETKLEDDRTLRSDIFVAEPHLQLAYSISPWVQLATGAHYRIVRSGELPATVSEKDLSSFSLSLSLKVGIFSRIHD